MVKLERQREREREREENRKRGIERKSECVRQGDL